ncbi:MAG: hypothetical protein ABI212_08030 [Burkholderiaceae bacterium]
MASTASMAETRHRFENWQVGLAHAVVFDALSVANKQPACVVLVKGGRKPVLQGIDEGFDQAAFANASLASDENQLALSLQRQLAKRVEHVLLGLAAHHRVGHRGHLARFWCHCTGRRRTVGNLCDEAIADAVRGGDEARLPRIVTK